jgi:hypothetical protein
MNLDQAAGDLRVFIGSRLRDCKVVVGRWQDDVQSDGRVGACPRMDKVRFVQHA